MTETEARRAVEILRTDFPLAEARQGCDLPGYRYWYVQTYGTPRCLETPEQVGRFIVGKIKDADPDDRAVMDKQDQLQAAKEERERAGADHD